MKTSKYAAGYGALHLVCSSKEAFFQSSMLFPQDSPYVTLPPSSHARSHRRRGGSYRQCATTHNPNEDKCLGNFLQAIRDAFSSEARALESAAVGEGALCRETGAYLEFRIRHAIHSRCRASIARGIATDWLPQPACNHFLTHCAEALRGVNDGPLTTQMCGPL